MKKEIDAMFEIIIMMYSKINDVFNEKEKELLDEVYEWFLLRMELVNKTESKLAKLEMVCAMHDAIRGELQRIRDGEFQNEQN